MHDSILKHFQCPFLVATTLGLADTCNKRLWPIPSILRTYVWYALLLWHVPPYILSYITQALIFAPFARSLCSVAKIHMFIFNSTGSSEIRGMIFYRFSWSSV